MCQADNSRTRLCAPRRGSPGGETAALGSSIASSAVRFSGDIGTPVTGEESSKVVVVLGMHDSDETVVFPFWRVDVLLLAGGGIWPVKMPFISELPLLDPLSEALSNVIERFRYRDSPVRTRLGSIGALMDSDPLGWLATPSM